MYKSVSIFAAWSLCLVAGILYFVNVAGLDVTAVMNSEAVLSFLAGTALTVIYARTNSRQAPEMLFGSVGVAFGLFPEFSPLLSLVAVVSNAIVIMLLRFRLMPGLAVFFAACGTVLPSKLITMGADEDMLTPVMVYGMSFALAYVCAYFAFWDKRHERTYRHD